MTATAMARAKQIASGIPPAIERLERLEQRLRTHGHERLAATLANRAATAAQEFAESIEDAMQETVQLAGEFPMTEPAIQLREQLLSEVHTDGN